jgi:hypothetical protein
MGVSSMAQDFTVNEAVLTTVGSIPTPPIVIGQVAEWSKAISLKLIISSGYREFESLPVWQNLVIYQSNRTIILFLPLYLAMTSSLLLISLLITKESPSYKEEGKSGGKVN